MPGQPGLHGETLTQKTERRKKRNVNQKQRHCAFIPPWLFCLVFHIKGIVFIERKRSETKKVFLEVTHKIIVKPKSIDIFYKCVHKYLSVFDFIWEKFRLPS